MTKKELDVWAKRVAKDIKETSIYDLNRQRDLLNESKQIHLKFIELYGVE